ncbi:uncharacterized protein LOC124374669 isoform X1 [Homalodisca vitripennis]|uniref:uncharacterized protein LOC124374669 isoform X1 n=1 Tax=Homalodisca vitripennis TaxID=197043 RepID=UPI001EEA10BD|nr:uncharacterized protein LOC124374669 isoform X1 [Homalodisca vitripennis]
MAGEDGGDLMPPGDGNKCVFCRLSSRAHSWRSQVVSMTFQDVAVGVRTLGGTVVEHSVNIYHRGVTYSRDFYSWVMPTFRDGLQGTRQLTIESTRDLVDVFKDYAVVFFLYGLVAVLFVTLMFMPRSPDEDLQVYVLAMLFPIIFFWLPCYCWRNGLFDLFKSGSTQDGESCPHQTVTDKPPEYESLVFASAGPVTSCAAPPTYEEAIPVAEETRILPPEYSRCTNVAVSLCPVHQHSTSRHPGVVQQETRTHRSKSLGDLCDHDSELLLA